MSFKPFLLLFFIFFSVKINAQSTASKQVTKFSLNAPQLDTVKTIWVYLPKSYQNSEKRYPVVYMHDAQNLFDAESSFVGEWQVDEYLDSLTKNESIIIGIEHGNDKRIDELTPYSNEKYGGGNGDRYISFIKDNLKTQIDSTYRTKPEAENTTILGSSLGGLISFYAVVRFPETFGEAGVFSPAFWINPEIYELVSSTDIAETSKFYFLVGTAEGETMVPNLERMVNLLKSKGVSEKQIKTSIIEGGEHNEKFWSENFGKAYLWLYSN
ncbi:alpha/beta hydrolase [Winogradskyella ursingii]|uniref:alpha/beta hydrolase n=1 Tax=Winogradskyella ursingii TaxID=2686079 RepID=UPI0015CA6E28|nr:alpha/beta hydrolase-fold protein [Winogradskyella ursingii]